MSPDVTPHRTSHLTRRHPTSHLTRRHTSHLTGCHTSPDVTPYPAYQGSNSLWLWDASQNALDRHIRATGEPTQRAESGLTNGGVEFSGHLRSRVQWAGTCLLWTPKREVLPRVREGRSAPAEGKERFPEAEARPLGVLQKPDVRGVVYGVARGRDVEPGSCPAPLGAAGVRRAWRASGSHSASCIGREKANNTSLLYKFYMPSPPPPPPQKKKVLKWFM